MKLQNIYSRKVEGNSFNFTVGISTNHTTTQEHNKIRFRNQICSIDGLVKFIKERCLLYPIIQNPEKVNFVGYSVQSACRFSQTNVIPFDLDYASMPMEDFIALLPEDLHPTIAFKTRSNDDGIGLHKFRLLYISENEIISREHYYSIYEFLKDIIVRYTGNFGTDGYAYGLNPKGNSFTGYCCKPIRTNASSDIQVTYRIYNFDEIKNNEKFAHLDIGNTNGIDESLFSSELLNNAYKSEYLQLFAQFHYRDFSRTKSQFKNGFAFVRGNLNYAEYVRKFVMEDGKYRLSKWRVGEGRHKKLRMDALVARFNDYIENEDCTICADELFMILLNEVRRYFQVSDDEGGDCLDSKNILRIVTNVMTIDIGDVLTEVRRYLKERDDNRLRSLIRLDIGYWSERHLYNSAKKQVSLTSRSVARFIKLLKVYDPSQSIADNSKRLSLEKGTADPGCSIPCLRSFVQSCRKVMEFSHASRPVIEDIPSDISDLFADEPLIIKCEDREQFLQLELLVLEHLEGNDALMQKVENIAKSYYDFWKNVREGKTSKPRNGRPKSTWIDGLESADANLPLKDLIKKVHQDYPDAPTSSIKTWKYRMLKSLKS